MIAMSDCTAPTAMSSAARMAALNGAARDDAPNMRPKITKMKTGTTRLPTTPIGSRMKTFVSIQLSFQSPLSTRQSLTWWPVSLRKTSSRVGASVRKPRTRVPARAMPLMTSVTKSSPAPRSVSVTPVSSLV